MMQYLALVDYSSLPHPSGTGQEPVQHILTMVFSISASIALLIMVIAGLRYITAHGDPNAVAQARNTILYALIGLLVVLAAYSIVYFVLGKI